jgi:hypothetical protein
MHKILSLIIILVVCTLSLAACNSVQVTSTVTTTTTTTTQITSQTPTTEAPDDIIWDPAGIQIYRANTNGPNWSAGIETAAVGLGSGAEAADIQYRDYIETNAGQTRNNIFIIYIQGQDDPVNKDKQIKNVILSVYGLPHGITTNWDSGGFNSFNLSWNQVMEIAIASDVQPNYYDFYIDVKIEGKDYGQIPCTIKVLQQ